MAIRYYDEAVFEKIKHWVKDPNMTILKPSETSMMFKLRAAEENDKPLKLPLIALTRDSSVEILNTTKKSLSYDGGHLSANTKASQLLNAIPISITYQLDIYTRHFAEADEYVRNFVFNIINYPTVHIEVPYNDAKVVHDSNMVLTQSITDNSDIPERLVSGQFTRMTLRFSIDDAYLFSVPFMDNWNVIYEDEIKIEGED